MILPKFRIVVVLAALLPLPAHALVLGREGTVYPIRERNFLEVIEERIARVALSFAGEPLTIR